VVGAGLATLLPVTVNGMGVREGVLVAMLARHGVDVHRAAVLAVLADLQALPIVLVGAVCGSRAVADSSSRGSDGGETTAILRVSHDRVGLGFGETRWAR
jgi:hypothetical protein